MLGRASGREIGVVPRDDALRSEKPEFVGQASDDGHPIIDEDKHLVGIITQSDLVSALYRLMRRPG